MRKILMILVVFSLAVIPGYGSNERLDRWFVFGTNLAWFKGGYGSDIGPNRAEGWGTSFSEELCEKIFANLGKMGCPVVRIWAFERQEGLVFTADLTTDPAYPYHEVTGLDEEFMKNCAFIMETALRHKVKVYWSMLNHLIREEQQGRHMRIITDPKVRGTYIRNALLPFLEQFAGHPAFFAVDLINEADGAVGGLDFLSGGGNPRIGCSWKVMRGFIKQCTDAIHRTFPGVKVTATSGWHEYENLKKGRFSGLGLDFYDWHSYRDDPQLPNARDLGLDKPVIIGECGPKTEKPDGQYSLQGTNWEKYCEQARKGYAGLLAWSYGNPGAGNNYVMVNEDHSWRAGANVIFRYTRGANIPDAGPLILSDEDEECLRVVNECVAIVLASGGPGSGSPSAALEWAKLVQFLKMYYPYINPRYARLVFNRLSTVVGDVSLSDLGFASALASELVKKAGSCAALAGGAGTGILRRAAGVPSVAIPPSEPVESGSVSGAPVPVNAESGSKGPFGD